MFSTYILLSALCSTSYGYGTNQTELMLLRNITKIANNILKIMEHEKSNNGPLRNLAYKKRTYQSSIWPSANSYNAAIPDRAVDGISNPIWDAGSCSHTQEEPNPYWYVDLGKNHVIKRIRITSRGDYLPQRLHDVKVTVAGYDKRFDVSCGFFKGPGIASQIVVIHCPQGTKGRYVRLQIMKGIKNNLTLCEVEVFGN